MPDVENMQVSEKGRRVGEAPGTRAEARARASCGRLDVSKMRGKRLCVEKRMLQVPHTEPFAGFPGAKVQFWQGISSPPCERGKGRGPGRWEGKGQQERRGAWWRRWRSQRGWKGAGIRAGTARNAAGPQRGFCGESQNASPRKEC